MAKDSSPFHQTEFHNIGDVYTAEGTLFGLRKPDGSIIVNYDQSTSYGTLKKIAGILGCEIVVVHGTWTFLPHRETTVNDSDDAENVDHLPEV